MEDYERCEQCGAPLNSEGRCSEMYPEGEEEYWAMYEGLEPPSEEEVLEGDLSFQIMLEKEKIEKLCNGDLLTHMAQSDAKSKLAKLEAELEALSQSKRIRDRGVVIKECWDKKDPESRKKLLAALDDIGKP